MPPSSTFPFLSLIQLKSLSAYAPSQYDISDTYSKVLISACINLWVLWRVQIQWIIICNASFWRIQFWSFLSSYSDTKIKLERNVRFTEVIPKNMRQMHTKLIDQAHRRNSRRIRFTMSLLGRCTIDKEKLCDCVYIIPANIDAEVRSSNIHGARKLWVNVHCVSSFTWISFTIDAYGISKSTWHLPHGTYNTDEGSNLVRESVTTISHRRDCSDLASCDENVSAQLVRYE